MLSTNQENRVKVSPTQIRNLLIGKRSDDEAKKTVYQNELEKQTEQNRKKKIYIILENVPLKIGYIGKDITLLNSNDHKKYISTKTTKDIKLFRPDIVHRVSLFSYE